MTMRGTFLLLLAAALSLPLLPAYGSSPYYVQFLPDTNQVSKDFRDIPSRIGAYFCLSAAIQKLSGQLGPSGMTPDVAAKFQAYQQEIANAHLDQAKVAQFRRYGVNPQVERLILPLYFPPPVLAQFGIRNMASRQVPQGGQGNTLPGQRQGGIGTGNPYYREGGIVQRNQGGIAQAMAVGLVKLYSSVFTVIVLVILPTGLIGLWVYHKIINSRRYWVPRSNREAIQVFGSDPKAREQQIIDAFENPEYSFRFVGTNLEKPYRMRFVLVRQGRSIRRGDLESMRFAYLAYNRGKLDDEKFHGYRFSAIYGDGMTDTSECEYVGWFDRLKVKLRGVHGQISQSRATVQQFAGPNAIPNMESLALAAIHKLVAENPTVELFRDMQTRFLEGVYWLSKGDLRESASVFHGPPSRTPYWIIFGILAPSFVPLLYSGEGSIITIAPPGSGKTQCNVFPNLLMWPGPAVVLDVKGEIYDGTSGWRSRNVGPVIKFSPLDPGRSACYNPLTQVRRDALYLWEDARFLADMMIVPSGAQDPFWENRARDILTLIIADLAFWNRADERPMSKVMSLINRVGWKEFVERCQDNPEVSVMRDEATSLASMEAKTLDGILQTAKSSLSAWAGERINMVTKKSDWAPIDLRNGKNMTIYMCLKPNEIKSYTSLLRVFIAQHIRGLTSDLPPRGAAPILFVLDEFPQLQNMPPILEALEVGRQYGIRLWMFAQYMSQIQKAYGESAQGMIGACAVRTFMNPSLQDGTAKALSEQIGLREGEQHGGKGYAITEANKYIVDANDLAGPGFKEVQIVMGVGSKPARVIKMYAHKDPELKKRMALGAADSRPASVSPIVDGRGPAPVART